MIFRNLWQSLAIVITVVSPIGSALAIVPSQPSSESYSRGEIALEFPAAPNRSSPGSTSGGGTRGGICTDKTQTSLTALMPTNQIATTAASNPSFFWYMPKTGVNSAEFTVIDPNGEAIYSQEFQIPQQSGLIKISLPDNTLQENKSYLWELAIVCDPSDRSADTYVYGTLQRFSLNNAPTTSAITPQQRQELLTRLKTLQTEQQQTAQLIQQLERQSTSTSVSELEQLKQKQTANTQEQAEIYAKLSLWSETLNLAAQLRNARPQEWQQLLESVGIREKTILDAPFVDIVTVGN